MNYFYIIYNIKWYNVYREFNRGLNRGGGSPVETIHREGKKYQEVIDKEEHHMLSGGKQLEGVTFDAGGEEGVDT